jgi:hypothetical protein
MCIDGPVRVCCRLRLPHLLRSDDWRCVLHVKVRGERDFPRYFLNMSVDVPSAAEVVRGIIRDMVKECYSLVNKYAKYYVMS